MTTTTQPPKLFASDERLHIADPAERKRVLEITCQLMEGMVRRGKLDLNDKEALKAATKQCASDALAAYRAAVEFMCG